MILVGRSSQIVVSNTAFRLSKTLGNGFLLSGYLAIELTTIRSEIVYG